MPISGNDIFYLLVTKKAKGTTPATEKIQKLKPLILTDERCF
jgi:hypothetical protein